jgi:hypothetical protein
MCPGLNIGVTITDLTVMYIACRWNELQTSDYEYKPYVQE